MVSLGYVFHYCFITVLVGEGNSSCFSNKEEVVTRGCLIRKPPLASVSVAERGPQAHRCVGVLGLSQVSLPGLERGRCKALKLLLSHLQIIKNQMFADS